MAISIRFRWPVVVRRRKATGWSKKEYNKVDLVYVDKFGNRFFAMKDPTQLSHKRFIAAQIATRMAQYNLTEEVLATMIRDMRARANDGNIVGLFAILEEMDRRRQYAGEEETLAGLAAIYFMLEGEDLDEISPGVAEEKKNLWLKDTEACSFFLQAAWQSTASYAAMSIPDIVDYLSSVDRSKEVYMSTWAKKYRSTLLSSTK